MAEVSARRIRVPLDERNVQGRRSIE
jgi:hypothetical protein